MSIPVLSEIYIYPVKSLAGINVTEWPVTDQGLLYDRKWMLVDNDNVFLSQRRLPKMALIKTRILDQSLILSTASSGSISIPLNPENGDDCITQIWDDHCPAKTISEEADRWLSDFLETDCKLVYQPDSVIRPVDPTYALPSDKINFSDGFPFLLLSEASLAALNQTLENQIPVQRFRPNLVISNCHSYAEDIWRELEINDITFRLPKPCSRCIITTIDTETAERNKEPLLTLQRKRKWNNQVFFGQNAIHNNSGQLLVGSSVKVLQTGPKQPPL